MKVSAIIAASALALVPSAGAFAQSNPAPSIPLVPPSADQPSVSATYAALLKRLQQGDMTVNFRSFRLAGALMTGQDASMKEQAESRNFKRLLDAGSTQEALDAANQAIDRNYASLSAHLNALTACNKLNRPAEAALHRRIINALLDSIQRSGDGKSSETAWFVVTISEEYVFLGARLSLQRTKQSLVRKDGHAYDQLEVLDPKTNEKQNVWFNTDVDLALYRPPAAKTPETAAKLQRALQFYIGQQDLKALPLIQDLAASDPSDAALQWVLADCLAFKADTDVTGEESLALLKLAREAAGRAWQLGENSQSLNEL
jgi:hypothetical protein